MNRMVENLIGEVMTGHSSKAWLPDQQYHEERCAEVSSLSFLIGSVRVYYTTSFSAEPFPH